MTSSSGRVERFTESVRLYERPELTAMCQAAGLAVERVAGDFQGAPWTSRAQRLILLCHRARTV